MAVVIGLLAISAIGAYTLGLFDREPVTASGTVFGDQALRPGGDQPDDESGGARVETKASTVSLVTPTDGTRIAEGASLVLGAEVLRGRVVSVEFLLDGEVLAETSEVPFLVEWPRADPGTHLVAIRVTDGEGDVSLSDPVSVHVGVGLACSGVTVGPNDDIQKAIDSSGPGTTICFTSGEYRLDAPLVPRSRQRLVADGEVILNGSEVVERWRRDGNHWVSEGQRHDSEIAEGAGCEPEYLRCGFNEDVFIDNMRLDHAPSRSEVAPGQFFSDRDADEIVIGEDPSGHTVEVAVATGAIASLARDVTVSGFVVEKFATPHQQGAVDGGEGWVIESNEARLNHAVGIKSRPHSVVRGNYVHHNGQFGLAGNGTRTLVESNTLVDNGDILWCCGRLGGSKWVLAEDLIVRGNVAREHERNGLWTDINNVGVLYEFNVLADNGLFGIHHEISYDAVLRYNLFERNGYKAAGAGGGNARRFGADLTVTSSSGVEIYGNVFYDSAAAVVAHQANRSDDHPSDLGPHDLADVDIHHNRVYGADGYIGTNIGGSHRLRADGYLAANNIGFSSNAYFLSDLSAPFFRWGNRSLDFRQWQAEGNDVGGSIRQWDRHGGDPLEGYRVERSG